MGLLTSRDNGVSAVDARLAGLELEVRDLASRAPAAGVDGRALEEVVGRVDTLEAAVVTSRPAAGDPSLSSRIAAINGEVKALAEPSPRSAAAATMVSPPRARRAPARRHRRGAHRAGAEASRRRRGRAQPGRRLAGRVAAVENSEKAVARGDRAVRLVLVATALKAAAERGEPFAAELAAAKALGADPTRLRPRSNRSRRRAYPRLPCSRASSPRSCRRCVRPRRRRHARVSSSGCRSTPRSWCACARPTRSPAPMPPPSLRVSKARRRRRTSPVRRPSSPSCRRRRARQPRPGSSRCRRAAPR